MKVPLSWLSEFVTLPNDLKAQEIENAFVKVGFEIENIDHQGAEISGPLVVAKVVEIEELVEHKKPIRYVTLDCGESAVRYVICGARNFEVGDLVVAALPGAVLPGDVKISARETYGKISDGMICSGRELGISEDHNGIIVLSESVAVIGADAIALLEINDMIIDVAVNPDRGYALSVRGLARELATSLNVAFRDPAEVDYLANVKKISGTAVQAIIEDQTGAELIVLRTVENVDPNTSTPLWVSRRIEKCGMRSISIAVDITNYVMLELGQPLHAFDADKIEGTLRIKRAGSASEFITLDNQKRTLQPENLMIADDAKFLALAGTMGGLESEVTSQTHRIALESAHFNPIAIAKNSRSHKLSSEASRRLERFVDPAVASVASARAISLLVELTGASYVGESVDGHYTEQLAVIFKPSEISARIGFEYSKSQIEGALTAIGAKILQKSDDEWVLTPPSWRPDIQVLADISEEVARINGFDLIPSKLPVGPGGATLSPIQYRKRQIALLLANLGFSESYNYPFVSPEMIKTLGFVGARAASFKIANPMSDEAPLLRTHLLPGLLSALSRNISRGSKDVAIFEIGTVFRDTSELAKVDLVGIESRPSEQTIAQIYASVPKQPLFAGAVVAGSLDRNGWWGEGRSYDWSDAIAHALRIVEESGNVGLISASDFAPWHPGRCAEIQVNGKAVAHAGELHPRVLEELGLPPRSCAFAVNLTELEFAGVKEAPQVWTMPAARQDLALVVGAEIPAAHVESLIREGAGELLESITLFDRYEIEPGKISLAFALVFRAPDRTLTAAEVSGYRESAAALAVTTLKATIRE